MKSFPFMNSYIIRLNFVSDNQFPATFISCMAFSSSVPYQDTSRTYGSTLSEVQFVGMASISSHANGSTMIWPERSIRPIFPST